VEAPTGEVVELALLAEGTGAKTARTLVLVDIGTFMRSATSSC
jgi:hypothetical protein